MAQVAEDIVWKAVIDDKGVIKFTNKAGQVIKEVDTKVGDLEKKVKKTDDGFGKMANTLKGIAGILAIKSAFSFLQEAGNAATELNTKYGQLNEQLRLMGKGGNIDAVKDSIESLSKVSIESKGAIADLYKTINTKTIIPENLKDDLAKLSLDIGAVKGESGDTIAKGIIDNLISSVQDGNVFQAFRSLGLKVNRETNQLARQSVASGNYAPLVANVIKQLEKQYEGASKRIRDLDPNIDIAKEYQNILVDIGNEWQKILVENKDDIKDFIKKLGEVVKWLLKNKEVVITLGKSLAGIYAANAINNTIKGLTDIGTALKVSTDLSKTLKLSIAGLGIGLALDGLNDILNVYKEFENEKRDNFTKSLDKLTPEELENLKKERSDELNKINNGSIKPRTNLQKTINTTKAFVKGIFGGVGATVTDLAVNAATDRQKIDVENELKAIEEAQKKLKSGTTKNKNDIENVGISNGVDISNEFRGTTQTKFITINIQRVTGIEKADIRLNSSTDAENLSDQPIKYLQQALEQIVRQNTLFTPSN